MSKPAQQGAFGAVIVGCGDVGRRVGARLRACGMSVLGVTRTAPGCERIRAAGLEALQLDLDDERWSSLPALSGALLFYFAPPAREGETDARLGRFLARLDTRQAPARLVYISTSGVYGDCSGAWVDETWPLAPRTARARRRAAAEQCLRAWSRTKGADVVVLRVPGIYGPGRLPLERLRRGLPVVREGEAPFSNRIHVDDLAAAAVLAAQRAPRGRVYNVGDGHPTSMTDYFNRVADWAGLARPPQITLAQARRELSPAMLSFVEESRRLDCRRLFGELGFEPRYPDLDAGLASCRA